MAKNSIINQSVPQGINYLFVVLCCVKAYPACKFTNRRIAAVSIRPLSSAEACLWTKATRVNTLLTSSVAIGAHGWWVCLRRCLLWASVRTNKIRRLLWKVPIATDAVSLLSWMYIIGLVIRYDAFDVIMNVCRLPRHQVWRFSRNSLS